MGNSCPNSISWLSMTSEDCQRDSHIDHIIPGYTFLLSISEHVGGQNDFLLSRPVEGLVLLSGYLNLGRASDS